MTIEFVPIEKKERYNVLVVEDKQVHRDVAIKQLKDHNLTVATNYVDAIEKLKSKKPDILLTDMFFSRGRYTVTEDWKDERPLGYAVALYAARPNISVPRIGIFSDLNHHSNAVSATFDDFRVQEISEEYYFQPKGAVALKINNSFLGMFDIYDFQKLLNQVYNENELREKGLSGDPMKTVKNWKGVLDTLVNGPVSNL